MNIPDDYTLYVVRESLEMDFTPHDDCAVIIVGQSINIGRADDPTLPEAAIGSWIVVKQNPDGSFKLRRDFL